MSFRFVHAADLHLDSPFQGLRSLDPETGRALQRATFDAFENIVALCLDEKVDALVVSGDVYDGADRSLKAQLAFRDGLARLADAGIRSFIAHGNHDPLNGWRASLTYPDAAHRFGPAVETVTLAAGSHHVAIHGYSYPRRVVLENIAADFRADPHADLNIAVLHGTVGTQPGHDPYAPCSLADLTSSGMDYWAMGHVHERQVVREQTPAVVYPGNPQGRHLKERGARGVYLVELEPGRAPRLEFRAVDVVRWERLRLSIDEMATEQELLDAITNGGKHLASISEGRLIVAAVELKGEGLLHDSLRRRDLGNELIGYANGEFAAHDQRVFIAAVEDRTGPLDLSGDGGFIAEVLAAAEHLGAGEPEEIELAVAELFDHPAFRFLERPGAAELESLIDGARVVAVGSLREAGQ